MLTIANKSNSKEFLDFAYQNGVRDFRVNMAYEEDALCAISRLRALPNDIRVFIDYPAEKQRILFADKATEKKFNMADEVRLSVGDKGKFYITNTLEMLVRIQPGHHISFADGKVIGDVICKNNSEIVIKILKGGVLRNNAGCCFVGDGVPSPAISPNYCKSILHSSPLLQNNGFTTWVILSFVSDAQSIEEFVAEMHKRSILVMAKIETPDGVNQMEAISHIADGILIGRGDLKNISGDAYDNIYHKALNNFSKLPQIKYKGIGTFFLLKYAMSKELEKSEITDLLDAQKRNSDFVMFSKEVVNSNYPRETVMLANKIIAGEM